MLVVGTSNHKQLSIDIMRSMQVAPHGVLVKSIRGKGNYGLSEFGSSIHTGSWTEQGISLHLVVVGLNNNAIYGEINNLGKSV